VLPQFSISKLTAPLVFKVLAACSLLMICAAYALNISYLALAPFGFVLVAALLLDFRIVYYALLFALPISVNLLEWGYMSIDVPDEPLMIMLTAVAPIIILKHRATFFDVVFLRNALVNIIGVFLLWTLVTSLAGTNIIVSLKFTMAKLWFITPFMLLTSFIVYHNPHAVRTMLIVFFASLVPMLLLIMFRHWQLGFSFEDVNTATAPFFRNHVLYGSICSLMVPLAVAAILLSKQFTWKWFFAIGSLLLGLTAVGFAYSRGAWAAVVFAAGIWWAIRMRIVQYCFIAFYILLGSAVAFLCTNNKFLEFAPSYETGIMHEELVDHLIATIKGKDISSNERFYRWVAAVRMSTEHPIAGVGPNNFYEHYKQHAVALFKTYVSANHERSTTHNYFLFMLVEQGIIGLLIYASLIFAIFYKCQQMYWRMKHDKVLSTYILAIAAMMGAFFMNNFLSELVEYDKLGSLFFIGIGVIVALELRWRKNISLNNDYQGSTNSTSGSSLV
jgi:O-antigen ligase